MKFPHIPFYTGDWLKDPAVSVCNPATRGIWFDLLCAMHECDRCGELRGTSEQLARLARCSTVELEDAFSELKTTNAAEVEYQDGIWKIVNRRMKNEALMRQGGQPTLASRPAPRRFDKSLSPVDRRNRPADPEPREPREPVDVKSLVNDFFKNVNRPREE